MSAAENLAPAEQSVLVPIGDIVECSVPNYRKKIDDAKLADLESSVRENGIRVPLVLRPTERGLELVVGARRRTAATAAGLTEVPCFIRELSDDEVRLERMLEHHREDPDPLDEAEAFAELLRHGLSEGQVAARLGQPLRYVQERLALNTLCEAGRKALAEGQILLGVATLIATLPNQKMQQDALEECSSVFRQEVMTVAGAREAIQNRVLLQLEEAPFKLDDAELVPAAGACTACQKRTGHQGNLFGQTDKDDLCLDGTCHRSKVDALYQLRVKKAKAEGQEVLSKKASAEALKSASPTYGTGALVKLEERVYLPGGKSKTLKQLFGKELPAITVARNEETGAPVELVPRKTAEAVIKAANPAYGQSGPAATKAKDAKQRDAERLQAEVRKRVLEALIEATEDHGSPQRNEEGLELLKVLVLCAINTARPDIRKAVANRRGCPLTVEEGEATSKRGKGKRQEQLAPEERLVRLLPSLDNAQLAGLLLELLISAGAPGKWAEAHDSYVRACEVLHVSIATIEGTIKAEQKIKADDKARAAKAPKKAKAAAKPKPKKRRRSSEPESAEASE